MLGIVPGTGESAMNKADAGPSLAQWHLCKLEKGAPTRCSPVGDAWLGE